MVSGICTFNHVKVTNFKLKCAGIVLRLVNRWIMKSHDEGGEAGVVFNTSNSQFCIPYSVRAHPTYKI